MKPSQRYALYVVIFALLLILSIHGVKYIPAWNFRGLDLQNFYFFHTRCPGWPVPYARTGAECGDPLGRAMVYPPLIYWAMSWTRFLPLSVVEILWSAAIPLLTVLGTVAVERSDSSRTRVVVWALWSLAFLQMPMVYAVERGNNDAAFIPVYAAAIWFFSRKQFFWSGSLLAAACWMKVYPVIPSAILLVALGSRKETRKKEFLPLFEGFCVGGIVLTLLLFPSSLDYAFKVLPELMKDPGGFGTSSHSLYRGTPSLFLKIPVLALWAYLTVKTIRRDPILVLAAGLAISTFFQNLSNDYNLITAYPFLFLVLKRILHPKMNATDFGMLVLTFAAFVGDRTLLEIFLPNRSALFLQIFWLILFPQYLLIRLDQGRWKIGEAA